MARLGRKLVDGKGTSRVLQVLSQEGPKISPVLSMTLVKARERDAFLKMAEQHFRELNREFTPDHDWKNFVLRKYSKRSEVFVAMDYCRRAPRRVHSLWFGEAPLSAA